MGSILRITKAEFVKTFKRPTIYIMAFILLITAIISAFVFNPQPRTDDRINYTSATSSIDVYNTFNSSATNSKSSFDAIVNNASTKVDYFAKLENRNKGISDAYDNVLIKYNALKKSSGDGSTELDNYKQSLQDYRDAINNKYSLTADFVNTAYGMDFYAELSTKIDKAITDATSKTAVISSFENVDLDGNTQADILRSILNTSKDFIKNTISEYISKANVAYTQIWEMDFNGGFPTDAVSRANQDGLLSTIKNNVNNIESYIESLYSAQYNIIYMTTDEYKEQQLIKTELVNGVINNTIGTGPSSTRRTNLEYVAHSTFVADLKRINANMRVITVDNTTLRTLSNASEKLTANLNTIVEKIEQSKSIDDMNVIKGYVSDYSIMCNIYSTYVNDVITLHSTKGMSLGYAQSLKGDDFENYNKYEMLERKSLNEYKIMNNVSGQNNLNYLAFNNASGYEKNGYDYMFFTLSIMTVLIVIFAIMMTAISVGSEQDSGTIKLLLVRPFTRTQILISKLLSVFFFILTFAIFSFAISFIAGISVYGLPNTTVLATFNATTTFAVHPILLLLIYLATIIFQVCFYTAFAFAIAVIFKNFAAALVSSLIVYLGGITCNILLAGKLAFKFIPFTNSYLFRYFGGAFAHTGTQLTNIFVSPIYSSMHFVWSIIICLLTMTIFTTISLLTFHNRDF